MFRATTRLSCFVLLVVPCFGRTDLSDLRASWESNWAGLSDIEVAFDHEWNTSSATTAYSFVYRWADHAIFWDSTETGTARGQLVSFDSVKGTGRRWIKNGSVMSGSRNYVAGGGTDWSLTLLRNPYHPDSPNHWKHTDLGALLAHSKSVVRPEGEVVDGRDATVVDVIDLYDSPDFPNSLTMTVWLDAERNAVPLLWTYYPRPGAGGITGRLSDYVQVGGRWFPLRAQLLHGIGPNAGVSSEMRVKVVAGAPSIRVNQGLSAADVAVAIPPRAPVVNEDTGELYVASGPRSTRDVLADAFDAGASLRGSQHRAWFFAGAGALGICCAFMARWRFTRRLTP
ncbi:MAG: hypothetical protein CHACPFDD_04079 [Phycisphaerae bacterium]|nr:hypothetical protein [Phycisphaerae bacterium]